MSTVTNPIVRLPSSAAPPNPGAVTILVVDDNLIDRRVAARILLQAGGWNPVFATNGVEALAIMEKSAPRLVLTDMQMPQMDGLTLVEQIRDKHPRVPVVLMTATGSEEIAVRALKAGAASYVPKRNLATALVPALSQVLAASRIDDPRLHMLSCITQQDVRFTLPCDPALIPAVAAHLREAVQGMGLCDATGATRVGIALEEALANAMYYGNLEVPSGLRQKDETAFNELVARRRVEPLYRHRQVRVFVNVTMAEAAYVIFDQGLGFDTTQVAEEAQPGILDKPGGRGMVLMRTFMDRVTYSKTGNMVTMLKKREARGVRP
jgi:CheY-like chemotaxis protein/anti-sigma regulatory factor (Ser/Thr protein kinase)